MSYVPLHPRWIEGQDILLNEKKSCKAAYKSVSVSVRQLHYLVLKNTDSRLRVCREQGLDR